MCRPERPTSGRSRATGLRPWATAFASPRVGTQHCACAGGTGPWGWRGGGEERGRLWKSRLYSPEEGTDFARLCRHRRRCPLPWSPNPGLSAGWAETGTGSLTLSAHWLPLPPRPSPLLCGPLGHISHDIHVRTPRSGSPRAHGPSPLGTDSVPGSVQEWGRGDT